MPPPVPRLPRMSRLDTAPTARPGTDLVMEARNITFGYGRLQVLFDVTLEVRRGEALALLGTNGAGKSTLLRVMSGLDRPWSGTVHLGGADVTGVPAERLVSKGVVLVSGGKAVFPDMSVEENLRVQALTIRKQTALVKERTDRVFSTFPRLAERRSQLAGRMSGGEQQQLALAKALLLDPEVLCIDELSLGLAPVVVGELIEIVREINRQGTTVVVVEQSLNIAADLCERAVFLEKGEVRFEGLASDLLEKDDIARAVFFGAS